MSRKWYGSLNNRVDENKMYCDKIEVGTGMTEYSWSDRHAYEVTAVKDQKHVTVREYDHKHVGEEYTNNWELISNPENPERELVKRGDYWYWTVTVTVDDLKENTDTDDDDKRIRFMCWLCTLGIHADDIFTKGKVTKRRRANVSFGVAD